MKSVPQSCEDCLKEFGLALEDLQVYVERAKKGPLNESQSRELINSFEVTHELALKVMSNYFQRQGKGPFSGSRDLTVEAFHADLIDDGKAWLDIVIDRIQYNPIYEIDTQAKFIENIKKLYMPLFHRFEMSMGKLL
ncbi:nucleotidyltransferase substrate binding protein [Algoriphagus namhaensis]